jgi:hypothetical protein
MKFAIDLNVGNGRWPPNVWFHDRSPFAQHLEPLTVRLRAQGYPTQRNWVHRNTSGELGMLGQRESTVGIGHCFIAGLFACLFDGMARQDALDGHPSERLAILGELSRQFRRRANAVGKRDAAGKRNR